MAKIGVVAVPFLRSVDAAIFMQGTINSLRRCQTTHTLDTIAIINDAGSDARMHRWIAANFDWVEENDANIVARAWNKGIDRAFSRGADYVLVINLDLLFHPQFVENLVSFARAQPEALMWSGMRWGDEATLQAASLEGPTEERAASAAFLIDRRLFDRVGRFDEGFQPAYFEDEDMEYRLKLAGLQTRGTPAARFVHYENVTFVSALTSEDTAYVESFRAALKANERRYIEKWGGLPGKETFTAPFNRSDR